MPPVLAFWPNFRASRRAINTAPPFLAALHASATFAIARPRRCCLISSIYEAEPEISVPLLQLPALFMSGKKLVIVLVKLNFA